MASSSLNLLTQRTSVRIRSLRVGLFLSTEVALERPVPPAEVEKLGQSCGSRQDQSSRAIWRGASHLAYEAGRRWIGLDMHSRLMIMTETAARTSAGPQSLDPK